MNIEIFDVICYNVEVTPYDEVLILDTPMPWLSTPLE